MWGSTGLYSMLKWRPSLKPGLMQLTCGKQLPRVDDVTSRYIFPSQFSVNLLARTQLFSNTKIMLNKNTFTIANSSLQIL